MIWISCGVSSIGYFFHPVFWQRFVSSLGDFLQSIFVIQASMVFQNLGSQSLKMGIKPGANLKVSGSSRLGNMFWGLG
jgi:hypothetical protein